MNYYFEVWRKYAEFEGRARRKEYWYFTLTNFMIFTPAAIITTVSAATLSVISILSLLYGLVTLVPSIAVTIRRLHDTGRSAWWILLPFVPVVGTFVFLIFMALPGDPETNEYGPNPIRVANDKE